MSRSYAFLSGCFGIYGFSRQYRIEKKEKSLYTDKIGKSFINSVFYIAPIINIYQIIKLVNRIEIKYNTLDKNNYKIEYTEFSGVLFETI